MYLLAKLGSDRTDGNGHINSYVNSYMNTFEKAELTDLVCHIERFLKSGIPICNSDLSDTAGRKTRRRRRAQAIAKHFAFYTKSKSPPNSYLFQVNNRNTRKSCEICLKLTIKPPERRQLVFLLLTSEIFHSFF